MSSHDTPLENTSMLDAREIALEGSVNFRDLGGLMNRQGQTVRQGRIFRSDALAQLTPIDLDRLAGLHIATLIDLRSATEIARTGPSPLTHGGTRVIHAPVTDVDASPEALSKPLAQMYEAFLIHGAASYHRVFSSLTSEEDLPAVIHCAAGKDRTGVAVALLLRVLDVPDETIVADYAITDRNIQRMLAHWKHANPETAAEIDALPDQLMRAHAETMETFLVALDATYGSAEEYLLTTGIHANDLDRLRINLLT